MQEVITPMMRQPITQCYWVVPGTLLAGEYPRNTDEQSSHAKIRALLHAGVTAFIDLTEAQEGLYPYTAWIGTASHQRFPIRDGAIPASPAATSAILDAIDVHLARRQPGDVHACGG